MNNKVKMSKHSIIIFLSSALSLFISIYTEYVKNKMHEDKSYVPVCDINEMKCSRVMNSEYSVGFGLTFLPESLKISNSLYGIVFYSIMTLLSEYNDILGWKLILTFAVSHYFLRLFKVVIASWSSIIPRFHLIIFKHLPCVCSLLHHPGCLHILCTALHTKFHHCDCHIQKIQHTESQKDEKTLICITRMFIYSQIVNACFIISHLIISSLQLILVWI